LSTRRKEAALDVERMVKNSVSAGRSNDDILALVDELVETYVHPQSTVHQRKGGLLCLAAVTVGLAGGKSSLCQSENLLAKVLPPMLGAAVDSDSGIRYYALEALYNVAKSTKPAILNHLSELIDILLVLCDDVEVKNQNATIFVSDLIKDIVGEHQQHAFDVAAVLERLVGYLRAETPNKRRFLLGWFSFFDSMSSANKYFASIVPDLVPALLVYRADSVPEVHHAAENLLKHILGDIQDGSMRVSVRDLLESLADSILGSGIEDPEDVAFHQSTQQIIDPRGFASCRSATLEWIEVLIDQYPEDSFPSYPKIVKSCLKCLDSSDYGVQDLALELNQKLQIHVAECPSGAFHLGLMDVVVQRIASSEEMAKLESLKWTALLMKTDAVSVCQIKPLLLHCLCDALSSTSDAVIEEAVVVLSVLSSIDSQGLDLTMKTIIQVFDGPGGATLLQRRGGIIVEKLCDLIPSENVIMPLVNQIKDLKDCRLRRMLIQVIDVLLLTSEKTKGCRALLQSKESDDFLRKLLSGFSSSISASLSVILLSRNYDVACVFLEMVAEGVFEWEMSQVLVELTQLITLFESPGFASVRLNLMDEKKHASLRKCMLAILMMLPQGEAFDTLFKRLQLVLGTSYSSSSGSKSLLSEHGIDMLKYRKTAELTSKQKDLLDIFLQPEKDS